MDSFAALRTAELKVELFLLALHFETVIGLVYRSVSSLKCFQSAIL